MPIKRDIESIKRVRNTTFLQLYKQYINTNLKYLQKINNIYYFVIKINKKIIKQSLKSNNLIFCNIQKLKILKYLTQELKMELNINPSLTIHIIEDEDDNPEVISKLKEKIKTATIKELKNGNLKTLTIDENQSITLSESIEKFLEYKTNVEKSRSSTIENYNSAFSYLYLFLDEKTNIKILNKKFFNELQSSFMKIPRDYMKKPKTKRENINIVLENKKDTIKLDSKTINKHFTSYSAFFDFLVRNDYIKLNPVQIKYLKEDDEIKKEEFEYEELSYLFKFEEKEYQNIFKFAYLTGMRRGEILNLKADDIENIENHNIIDIKEGKTSSSIRLIPTNRDIDIIIQEQKKKSKNGYIFFDEDIVERSENAIGKRLNRRIDKYLTEIKKDKSIKSFHSFRKNFTQTLYLERFNIKEQTISKLLGHSVNENITRSVYNKNKVERNTLIYAMSCITLENVEIFKNENLFMKQKEKTIEEIKKITHISLI